MKRLEEQDIDDLTTQLAVYLTDVEESRRAASWVLTELKRRLDLRLAAAPSAQRLSWPPPVVNAAKEEQERLRAIQGLIQELSLSMNAPESRNGDIAHDVAHGIRGIAWDRTATISQTWPSRSPEPGTAFMNEACIQFNELAEGLIQWLNKQRERSAAPVDLKA